MGRASVLPFLLMVEHPRDVLFNGWQRYKDHPEPRVLAHFAHQAHKLRTTYNAAWGDGAKAETMMLGPILAWTSKREDRQWLMA
ncbi:MAG TPA: hypothetical protein VF783_00705 [Terriglobales bacterium]